jgi:hypothetical protein
VTVAPIAPEVHADRSLRISAGPINVQRIEAGEAGVRCALGWELEIFGIANDFADPTDVVAGRILAYDDIVGSSEFHVAFRNGEPRGLIRLGRNDSAIGLDSFPTLRDGWRHPGPDGPRDHIHPAWTEFFTRVGSRKVADLTTQAVHPDERSLGVLKLLWASVVGTCFDEGVEYWTMALTEPLFAYYAQLFPGAVVAIGDVMPDYVGADSVPSAMRVRHPVIVDYWHRIRAAAGEPPVQVATGDSAEWEELVSEIPSPRGEEQ